MIHGETVVELNKTQKLAASLRGSLVYPHDAGYDQARTVWNASIDKRPGLVVRCLGVSDVMHALERAALPYAVCVEERQLAAAGVAPDEREVVGPLDLVHAAAADQDVREGVAVRRPDGDVVERLRVHENGVPASRGHGTPRFRGRILSR